MPVRNRFRSIEKRIGSSTCPECENRKYGIIRTFICDPDPVQVSVSGCELPPSGEYVCPRCGRIIESLHIHLHVVRRPEDDDTQNQDSSNDQ